ncbi:MAG TPA: response regulator [Candidatus Methylomirabilis sp.]
MNPPSLIIVDDEEEILRLLSRRYRRRGYRVVTAGSGAEALARIEETGCDVAIFDLMMPGMSGLELARRCRSRWPTLRMLILTGSPLLTEIEGLGLPYLRKPLENLQGVDEAVERLLAERTAEEPLGGCQ